MENTDLFSKAKEDLFADMKARGIGAVIWDNSTAGFDYLPEINLAEDDAEMPDTVGITGIYAFGGEPWLIEEGKSKVSIDSFYNPDTEVKPSVVTLTPDSASKALGDPEKEAGFTLDGSLEEWLAVADCYYQALSEEE